MLFSGAISDWIGKRKPLVLLGYGLAAATKPLFPLASGGWDGAHPRFVDRIGKVSAVRPANALIGDVTPVALRDTAFGLRQSMDTVGAFVGPLLAMLIMAASSDDFRYQLPQVAAGGVEFVDDYSASFQTETIALGPRNSSEQQRQRFSSYPSSWLR